MSTVFTPQQALRCANAVRLLSAEAVEKANSGHPGLPMGAADMAVALWSGFLRFNPADTAWANRDRFILSAGHGSMLLYSLLHLFGFDLSMEELKNFRQWGSKTPGHPEFGHTPGVEVTTGPLGQGVANGVGMALSAKMAAERFNTPDFSPITHRVFALVGDGDLQEGISYEAAALAGHLKLGNLIYLYDSNSITIEGKTDLAWSEDVAGRFEAAGWHVQRVDGHDHQQVSAALRAGIDETDRPSLIIATSHIAYGAPGKQDSSGAHGSPLGKDEIEATRVNLGWNEAPFTVPADVAEACAARVGTLQKEYDAWQAGFAAWRTANPDKAALWDALWQKQVPEQVAEELIAAVAGKDGATRALSGAVLQKAAALVPALVGGSADLAPSNNSDIKGAGSVQVGTFAGRNLHFGIREHAMGAVCNGMALYGCFIPFGATFLVFSDYCRPAVRLSALMQQQVIYIFTHDSYAVGEDGPTHQPIEHTASLRMIPGVQVIRPADGLETALAWYAALKYHNGPTVLVLTRQKLPLLPRTEGFDRTLPLKGGYLLADAENPAVALMASGSEVSLALDAAGLLAGRGIACRVISVPDMATFLAQPAAYRRALLPAGVKRVAIEAGRGESWGRLLGEEGLFIGVEHFGASAPAEVLAEQFGLTPMQVADKVADFLNQG
ncbi:transketolase [Trichlorobacter ammonificans]|uniref:Transketolase n=1 Tax=Trichlorobacter ammonificans TaxID=2916410 RepID=A0ABN8HLE6_9BACT|nr:transketolase [Trichlorobacter ammonificans]CAH2031765.1 Transketolase [Trichlorobacter ammonificans]